MGAAASLYVTVKADVRSAATALKNTETQFQRTGSAAKKMDTQLSLVGSNTRKSARSFDALGTSVRGATGSQQKFAPVAGKTAAQVDRLGRAQQSAKSAAQGMGLGTMAAQGGVLAFAYGAGKAIQASVDFDRSMRNVNSIAQLSEVKFDSLSDSVRGLAGKTAQSPQTLARGMYDLVSSGFKASDGLKILEASANAATAGLTTTEVSTSAVAAVLNAYHEPASKAGEISDTLFKTVDRGVISFEQLASNIGDVLPFASSLGVGLGQVGASISTMTKAGISPAETMTRIKAIMTALIQPSDALGVTMRQMGYNSAESMLKARGFQGSIDALARSTGGSKEKLAELFPNVRALGGVMALTGGNAKGAAADVQSLATTVGATKDALSQQKKSTSFKFDQAKADAEALAIEVGGPLADALGDAAKTASDIVSAVSAASAAIDSILGKGATKKGASFMMSGWRDHWNEIKNMGGKMSSMASQAWNGKKPARVPITVAPKIDNSSVASVSKQIKAAGKDGKVSLKVTTNAEKISPQMQDVIKAAKEANRQRPKVDFKFPGLDTGRSGIAQLRSDIGSLPASKTVTVKVHTQKDSKAGGGRTTASLVEVNERGPESVRYPDGTMSMLGDGRRHTTALPIGSYVYTASQTRRMFGAIPGYAKGGKVKKESRAQNALQTIDYLNDVGKLSDAGERKRLRGALRAKGKGKLSRDTRREIRRRLYGLNVSQKSRIQDLKDQAAAAGMDDKGRADLAVTTAQRHLQEAKRAKNTEARWQAEAELAQALADQKRTSEESTKALVTALDDNTKQMKANADFAVQMHTATQGVTDTLLQGILDKSLGGQLSSALLLSGPRFAT